MNMTIPTEFPQHKHSFEHPHTHPAGTTEMPSNSIPRALPKHASYMTPSLSMRLIQKADLVYGK